MRDVRDAGNASKVNALTVSSISKAFGRGDGTVTALDDLTLEVPRGTVYGLLGPNGAGKSTLMRIVAGMVRPDRGQVTILGERSSPAARRRLGMLIEAPSFYPFLTGREHVLGFARFAGTQHRVDATLARVGLARAADRRVETYSLGMKQRLGLACAIIHEPVIVVLDEPTNGLDPEGIAEIRALIGKLVREDGLTVLLSSHLLSEVEKVCDRVAVLRHGRLTAEGTLRDLTANRSRLRLTVDDPTAILRRWPAARMEDGLVVLPIDRERTPELLRAVVAMNVRLYEARWIGNDLEALFLNREDVPASHRPSDETPSYDPTLRSARS
ncbi:ABC transporter ATP-binding protein [Notoacmeibacter marinus]|uniref:ABC transporter ATP-binding protein n=1 Tax=Notoacmeibacter marinus TaxID=1876515 RepID=UPI001FE09DD1|nr:ABC transporter ATP-binding protein [Notoacmeibacter marinus]